MKKLLNKKISVKSLMILLVMIVSVTVALAAAPTQISALLSPNIKITYNGVPQTPRDANGNVVYPINYNGSIYLPIRGAADILGIDIDWDNDSKTVMLNDMESSTIVSLPGGGTIPGGGGRVIVNGSARYTLTPDKSGIWSIRTSDNGDDDPMLEVYDSGGRLIAEDDDSGWGNNALLFARLNAGSVYTVVATFYNTYSGGCVLTAAPAQALPAGGGAVSVNGTAAYTFTPENTGEWTFRTSGNGDSDPFLSLFDEHGNYIDDDDDSGDNMNAELTVSLIAGTTYIIDADFYDGVQGSYTLTIQI